MTERVDRETVEDIISTLNSIQFFDQVHDVDLSAAAKTLRALLAERDRLREALHKLYLGVMRIEATHVTDGFREARAALKGDQT